jgi:nucleoside-diphosphate-sugar epimerase
MRANTDRVLVTGAGGYLGSVLVGQLLTAGHGVVAVDRFFFGEQTLDAWRGHPCLEIVRDDVRTLDPGIFDGISAVADLAALSNDPSGELDPALTRAVNHEARVRLATAARDSGVERYVLSSSCSVYGAGGTAGLDETAPLHPLTTYALCNALAERDLLALSGPAFAVTAIRNATLFGISPRMRFDLAINLMTLDAVTTSTITVLGGGGQVRPFLHVADAARCLGTVLTAPAGAVEGQVFNAGTANHTIADLAEMIARRLPFRVKVAVVADDVDHRNYDVSFEKLRAVLAFRPQTSVAAGIDELVRGLSDGTLVDDLTTRTVAWYRSLMARGILVAPVRHHDALA